MNVVEIYLKEIHSVEPYDEDWCKEFPDRKFIKVDVTWNSYGHIYRKTDIYNTKMWSEIVDRGYYLG